MNMTNTQGAQYSALDLYKPLGSGGAIDLLHAAALACADHGLPLNAADLRGIADELARRATAGTTAQVFRSDDEIATSVMGKVLSRSGMKLYLNGDPILLNPSTLRDIVYFTVEEERATAGNAAPTDAATCEFDAMRLRRLVRAVGLEKAVPTSDIVLLGCLGTVLGMIASRVEKLVAGSGATPGDQDVRPLLLEMTTFAGTLVSGDYLAKRAAALLGLPDPQYQVPCFADLVADTMDHAQLQALGQQQKGGAA